MRIVTRTLPLGTIAALLMLIGCEDKDQAYPPDIAGWTKETRDRQRDAARQLLERLQQAIEKSERQLTIPPGHYRFNREGPKQFILRNVTDLAIDAAGVTFWFDGRYRIDSVSIQNCRNVSIRGLTVDYDPMCFAQGPVLAINETMRTVDVRIDPGFPLLDETWTEQDGSIKAIFYGKDRRQIPVRMDWIKSIAPLGERVFRIGFKFGWIFQKPYKADIKIDDYLTFPDRSMRHSFCIGGSESVSLEDITVFACPHMAFTEVGGKGGHAYRRCKVVRRPDTNRLLACNADVFHSTCVMNGPIIEECEFSHSGDDFVNIHGFFSMVLEQRSPTEVVIATQYEKDNFAVGDALRFYRFKDLLPLGEAKIKNMGLLEGKDVFDAAQRMPEEIRKTGAQIRDFHPRNLYPYLVELDRQVRVSRYDLVGSERRMGAGAVIRRNTMHDGFARGILLKCREAVVEDNTIERAGMGSVAVAAERFWMEGPFSHNIVIKNNTISESGGMLLSRIRPSKPGAITVISHGDHALCPSIHNERIRIVGNRVVRPSGCGIFVANARDCEITGNTIEAPFAEEPVDFGLGLKIADPQYAIYIDSAGDVVLKDNKVVQPTKHCRGPVGLGKWADKKTIRVEPE